MTLCIKFERNGVLMKQGRQEGGATGEICPGPHSARGPILTNVTSIVQFSAIDSYPCMLIIIIKLNIHTLQSLVHSIVY